MSTTELLKETELIPGEVVIGDFRICQKDYADLPWIYRLDGEGMAMGEETLKKFEKVIEDFYKEHL